MKSKNFETIQNLLSKITPFEGSLDDLKGNEYFKKLVSVCSVTKNISSIRFACKEGKIYTLPSVSMKEDTGILEKIYGNSRMIPFTELEDIGEKICFF